MTLVRITQRKDFQRVFRTARRVDRRAVVLFVVKNEQEVTRAAVCVAKRAGKAVERNRAKRIFWEALRKNEERIVPGLDIVVLVRDAASGVTWTKASAMVDGLCRAGNCSGENENG